MVRGRECGSGGHALLVTVGLLLSTCGAPRVSAEECPPAGFTKERLLELRDTKFNSLAAPQREALAQALLACLGNPDPQLRDAMAFESLATLLRSQQVSAATATSMLQRLQPQLAAGFSDRDGFAQPFAALTLAEVARMDRLKQFLSVEQWSGLLQSAAGYLSAVRDYRGFDSKAGWRHGVAHGADLLLQLGLNPRASKAELDVLLMAIAAQVAPAGDHFYIYGESLRLARPVFYIAQRNLHSEQEWRTWLQSLVQPAPLPSWDEAFKSQAGLAKRHNTVAFLTSLYLLLQENGTPAMRERLLEPLRAGLVAVP